MEIIRRIPEGYSKDIPNKEDMKRIDSGNLHIMDVIKRFPPFEHKLEVAYLSTVAFRWDSMNNTDIRFVDLCDIYDEEELDYYIDKVGLNQYYYLCTQTVYDILLDYQNRKVPVSEITKKDSPEFFLSKYLKFGLDDDPMFVNQPEASRHIDEMLDYSPDWDVVNMGGLGERYISNIDGDRYSLYIYRFPAMSYFDSFLNPQERPERVGAHDKVELIAFGLDGEDGLNYDGMTNKNKPFKVLGAIVSKIFEHLTEFRRYYNFISFGCQIESKRPQLYDKLAKRMAERYKGTYFSVTLDQKQIWVIDLRRKLTQ